MDLANAWSHSDNSSDKGPGCATPQADFSPYVWGFVRCSEDFAPVSDSDPAQFTRPADPHGAARADDSDLLCRIANRDRGAFAELFERYAGRVKSFLLRYALPDDQAEEIAQEVMVQVWRKAASYDPARAAPSTWIFAIARNKRIDAVRHGARRQADPLDPGLQPEPEPDGREVLSRSDRTRIVREAMHDLTEPQRVVLYATFFEGLSQSEIAARDGLPLGTVKSRIRLAFANMRERLGESTIGELRDD